MINKIKSAFAVAALTVSAVFGTTTAQAGVIDLGFALDGSGSVGASNWQLQIQGFAAALDNVTLDSRYRVTFVGFATTAQTIVGPTVIDSQATLDAVKAQVLAANYTGGWTNTSAAIDLMMTEWANAGYDAADKQFINISTDGNPCASGSSCSDPNSAPRQAALASASNAFAAGLDSLSAEAIGNNIDTAFLLDLVYPQPGGLYASGDALPNPLDTGFVLQVDNFQDLAAAVDKKIQRIVSVEVPAPSTALLLVGGLFGLVVARRRAA